jgi:glutamate/tyrosine decarboxylase-like PLP-dependent enzyme
VSDNALFPASGPRRAVDDLLSRALAAARDRVNRGSVVPTIDRTRFSEELASFDFENAVPLQQALDWAIAQMEAGLVHVAHPRYFGLFNPTPTFPAQCADRIAAVFNPQLATSTTSPAAVAIEGHVIRAVARRLGMPQRAFGHFTTGGAEANYTALLLALTRACPEFPSDGARAFNGSPTFYVSRESHLAWFKIAHQAGIGRRAARLVATDGAGRMDTRALSEAVRADLDRGHSPVMVVATAGTTNAGMIDPLEPCAALARDAGLWLHVDAAWGGAVAASERHRSLLAGVEQADSVTVDAHKWFAATMGCGMFLTRWPDLLPTAFSVSTGYMPSNHTDDPYVTTIQWSRRFVGLRLFLSLAAAGWRGYAEHVERTLSLAERLRGLLSSRGWRVVNQSPLGVVCVEPPPTPRGVREVVNHVLGSGKAWVSVAAFEGREVVRACVTSGETTDDDVEVLVNCLQDAINPRSEEARLWTI